MAGRAADRQRHVTRACAVVVVAFHLALGVAACTESHIAACTSPLRGVYDITLTAHTGVCGSETTMIDRIVESAMDPLPADCIGVREDTPSCDRHVEEDCAFPYVVASWTVTPSSDGSNARGTGHFCTRAHPPRDPLCCDDFDVVYTRVAPLAPDGAIAGADAGPSP